VIAFIAPCYEALVAYGARQGYGTPHRDVARVGLALFLSGGLVGGIVVYAVMASRRR
jgi:hypothetical protein